MIDETQPGKVIWLFSQLFMIPVDAFVYSVERFFTTIQGIQKVASHGIEVVVGLGNSINQSPVPGNAPVRQAADYTVNNTDNGTNGLTHEEEKVLNYNTQNGDCMDKNLHDDMLKLVRYKVLFVKRDYEWAFPEQEALVSDNMDGSAFTAWKIAEFIQQINGAPVAVPPGWKNYPGSPYSQGGRLSGFPPEDKKYLRVYYEVLERYTREKFRYEEEQIDVLKEIRDCICEEKEVGKVKKT